jgi:hypothetical protein
MQTLAQPLERNVWHGGSALVSVTTRSLDPAWDKDTEGTNYRLKDGDSVELKSDARGDFSNGCFMVPAGTKGLVAIARTPRVLSHAGTKSLYFANVDVEIDGRKGRIRVPHGALQIVRRPTATPLT